MKEKNPFLIYDLGNTIVPYYPDIGMRNMCALCDDPHAAKEIIPQIIERSWDLVQTGKMSDQEMHQIMVAEARFNPDFKIFQEALCSHIGQDTAMEGFVRAMGPTHTQAILSNSTATHWDYYNDRYPVLKVMDGRYASHLLGVVKPNPEAYHAVLKAHHRMPEESIFIDDLLPMVEGARAIGMRAIQFFNCDQLICDLRDMGVETPVSLPRPALHSSFRSSPK